nr:hypothetical protein [Blastocatellia bacterium]
ADSLIKFGIVDEIVPEPENWAIDNGDGNDSGKAYSNIAKTLKKRITASLSELAAKDTKALLDERYQKFRRMGEWV